MTQLSPHFTLEELTHSQSAVRLGMRNVPTATQIAALRLLCEHVLEPVREHFARPVIVSSGFRAPAVNRAIGGSGTSQHCLGEAADFTVPGISNLEVLRWMERRLLYDQLIYEFGESGWIHCSYRAGRLRNQELTARRIAGRTQYLPGLLA